jgi:hypothetical protein
MDADFTGRQGRGFTELGETCWSSSAGRRTLTLLAGDAEEVEAAFDIRGYLVDLADWTLTGSIDRPGGEEVSESVELDGCPKELDDVSVGTR